jgi:hypothetical protein
MTTVLAVYNSDGCVGRCDANCHAAKSKTCTCICGGKNHGGGYAAAVERNRELLEISDEQLAAFAAAHGYDPKDLQVVDRVAIPNARRARRIAKDKIIEPEFPFGGARP